MEWHSPFIDQLHTLLCQFLQRLAQQPTPLPHISQTLATLAESLGGLGFRSTSRAAIPAFVVPIARSIRLATNGIKTTNTTVSHMPPPFRATLRTWEHTADPMFVTFRNLATQLMDFHIPKEDDRLQALVHKLELHSLQRDLCRKKQKDIIPTLMQDAPTDIADCLASLTNTHMSKALHPAARSTRAYRLPPETYTLALQRKALLPCIPVDLIGKTCICGKDLDPLLNHITNCTHFGRKKKTQHDHLRDCLYQITQRLAPLAGFTPTSSSVALEPSHLIQNSNTRPADVGMPLSPTYCTNITTPPSSYLAIDVAVTKPPSASQRVPSYAASATHWHNEKAKAKFSGNGDQAGRDNITTLNNAQIQLLPFTIDPLGGLGSFAHRFLFGKKHRSKPCPLIEWCMRQFKRQSGIDVKGDLRAIERLRKQCEMAKRTLSTQTSATIDCEALANGVDFSTTLSRAKFEELNQDLFKKTMVPVTQVLKDAGMSKSDVEEIILVGGSTRIPKIQKMLSDYFGGKKLNKSINPDEAVVRKTWAGMCVCVALMACDDSLYAWLLIESSLAGVVTGSTSESLLMLAVQRN